MLISLNFPSFVSILQSKPLTSSADNLTPAPTRTTIIYFLNKK